MFKNIVLFVFVFYSCLIIVILLSALFGPISAGEKNLALMAATATIANRFAHEKRRKPTLTEELLLGCGSLLGIVVVNIALLLPIVGLAMFLGENVIERSTMLRVISTTPLNDLAAGAALYTLIHLLITVLPFGWCTWFNLKAIEKAEARSGSS